MSHIIIFRATQEAIDDLYEMHGIDISVCVKLEILRQQFKEPLRTYEVIDDHTKERIFGYIFAYDKILIETIRVIINKKYVKNNIRNCSLTINILREIYFESF